MEIDSSDLRNKFIKKSIQFHNLTSKHKTKNLTSTVNILVKTLGDNVLLLCHP